MTEVIQSEFYLKDGLQMRVHWWHRGRLHVHCQGLLGHRTLHISSITIRRHLGMACHSVVALARDLHGCCWSHFKLIELRIHLEMAGHSVVIQGRILHILGLVSQDTVPFELVGSTWKMVLKWLFVGATREETLEFIIWVPQHLEVFMSVEINLGKVLKWQATWMMTLGEKTLYSCGWFLPG